jgi:hypothetical protein
MAFLTMNFPGNRWQPGRNGFGLTRRFSALSDLPLIATDCNHGALSEEGLRVKFSAG